MGMNFCCFFLCGGGNEKKGEKLSVFLKSYGTLLWAEKDHYIPELILYFVCCIGGGVLFFSSLFLAHFFNHFSDRFTPLLMLHCIFCLDLKGSILQKKKSIKIGVKWEKCSFFLSKPVWGHGSKKKMFLLEKYLRKCTLSK